MNNEWNIKAIIGLGNPGHQYYTTRHSIGFRVVDAVADRFSGSWKHKDLMEVAEVIIHESKVILIKPQTFMNASGNVIPQLSKQGIKAENILVVHDELELSLGKLKLHFGGSARGHNGLRSIINVIGKDFARLSFGIARPERKEDVANYVLQSFSEPADLIEKYINEAVDLIENSFLKKM